MTIDSKKKLTDFLRSKVAVSDQEAERFTAAFKERKLRRKQLIVQPEFVAKQRFYVVDGALRSFILNESGNESTIALAIADWWITDYNSYIFQNPAQLFVEAISDSTVLQLDFDEEQLMKSESHKYETFFRIIAERGLAAQQRRIINNLTLTAEQRYEHFLSKYPRFVNDIPQYIIASFLGMSTEFLSKIRNNKTRKPKLN